MLKSQSNEKNPKMAREILPQQSNKNISLRCAKYKRKNEIKNNPNKKKES